MRYFSGVINFLKKQHGKITTKMEQSKINISGIDKQLVGETAAQIRRIKPPEPYKGKGIRYAGEFIKTKVGKSAGKK